MDSLGIRNNNPFNLRSNVITWLGKVDSYKGFCVFSDIKFGIRAGLINLLTQMRRSPGLNSLICRYAPSSENDTEAYFKYLRQRIVLLGYGLSDFYDLALHNQDYFYYLAFGIAYYESHYVLSHEDFTEIVNYYHIFDKHEKILIKLKNNSTS